MPFLIRPLLRSFFLLSLFSTLALSQTPADPDFTLAQPFTSMSDLPPFETFGSAQVHSDTIVLTPHSPSHLLGAIWSKKRNPYMYWEAEFSIRVSGQERGGQGLAFWYAEKRGLGGNVFGSVDNWDGLGVFFDANTGGRSTVRGHLNDGKTKYEGLSEPLTNAFGSCPFSFRTSSHPIVVKITNSKSSFKVTLNGNICFETNQVMLQPDSYFGISASTADVPDQHEVFDFKVTPLRADLSFLEKTVEQSIKEGNTRDGIQVVQDPAQASAGGPTYDEIKSEFQTLQKQIQEMQESHNLVLRRVESSLTAQARSISTISNLLTQLQKQSETGAAGSASIENTISRLNEEIKRLEAVLKDHMSGHLSILNQTLVGRGGFWKGIWMVVGVQVVGFVVYEVYRSRRKGNGKKLL